MPEKTPPRCPRCKAEDPRPILYGLPGTEMIEAAERGEIVLGGCVIRDDSAAWSCRKCGHRFGSLRA